MNPNQFTIKSREIIEKSKRIAEEYGNQEIKDLHLIKAMLDKGSFLNSFLRKAEISENDLKDRIHSEVVKLPKISGITQVYLSQNLSEVINQAEKEAKKLKDEYITVEHIILAIIEKGLVGKRIFKDFGIDKNKVLTVLKELRGNQRVTDENPEDKYQVLEKFTLNLSKMARLGKLDPVIGRDKEIRRTIQILSRRRKNNPVLIGDPGVGKTAIAEGLAHRIANKDVPENLKNKEILQLQISSILAGAKFRGQFEERMKALMKEVEDNSQIILFIDELHTVVGAGAAEGAVDASNMLKPALARGTLHCIGATTVDEYRKYIEKDAALERRFQPVRVAEPDLNDTVSILRGIKEKYEAHHGVRIKDNALVEAAYLSNRYISDRFLPDKAIDLVDETCAYLKMQIDSRPEELDKLERKIRQLEIEKLSLKKEKDKISKERLRDIKKEISNLKEESNGLKVKWQHEKKLADAIEDLSKKIDETKAQIEVQERRNDLNKVAELKYGTLPELRNKLKDAEEKFNQIPEIEQLLKQNVDEDMIAETVARWTNIPVSRLLKSERERLIEMESHLKERVVGQDKPIQVISDAIRRSRSGLSDPDKPIGSFLFLGPTGVGKTELAKTLSNFLFDTEKSIVRIDMSEYMEKHSVARLIGSPPGYIGYDQGGQLTENVRRSPYSVILFDEIEKAHRDVFNVLLQILDDGILTDGKGRTVDFRNTVIIMTSNIASDIIFENSSDNFDKMQAQIGESLKSYFKPEFLNRLDDYIIFHRLEKKHIREIVELQIKRLRERLSDKKINLKLTDQAYDYIAEIGYDPQFGARPLKRAIQREIENKIAVKILNSEVEKDSTLSIDVGNGNIKISLNK